MTGRPSIFSDALAATICERIADGETIRKICSDEAMPDKATVFRWLRSNPAFRDQYAQARDDQADTFLDDLIDISDDAKLDWQDRKVRITTRQWVMSKMAPKRYGDKTEITGKDGKDLIPETSPDAVARRLAFMLASGAAAQAPTKD